MNTSNKTLLQILVEELPKHGGWPQFQRELQAVQDADGEIKFHLTDYPLSFQRNKPGNWGSDCESAWLLCQVRDSGDYKYNPNIDCETLASDHATAIITREQYEAALGVKEISKLYGFDVGNIACSDNVLTAEIPLPAPIEKIKISAATANTDGWIDWHGGECPVIGSTMVEVRYRNGEIKEADRADYYEWGHGRPHFVTTGCDIIAYRLHQPQEAEQAETDDEADLNDCIGQVQSNDQARDEILYELANFAASTGTSLDIGAATQIAIWLSDKGYRKQ
jgi:hypothetical protein